MRLVKGTPTFTHTTVENRLEEAVFVYPEGSKAQGCLLGKGHQHTFEHLTTQIIVIDSVPLADSSYVRTA